MIKRFASHFIFLPGHGYLKQYVVGVEEGQVLSAFPLTEEIEGVEWFPGVIVLLNNEEDISKGYSGIFQKSAGRMYCNNYYTDVHGKWYRDSGKDCGSFMFCNSF